MTQEDRERLDRIEAMLAEVLAELRSPRKHTRRRGPVAPGGAPVSDEARERARDALERAGVYVRR